MIVKQNVGMFSLWRFVSTNQVFSSPFQIDASHGQVRLLHRGCPQIRLPIERLQHSESAMQIMIETTNTGEKGIQGEYHRSWFKSPC